MVDLRSDTVTRPTQGMLRAMMRAKVGDDVLGDDPTVIRLEEMAAEFLGQERSLFMPSGSMANTVAIKSWTQPGDEVILDRGAHSVNYEVGAGAALCGVMFSTLDMPDGILTTAAVEVGHPPAQHPSAVEPTGDRREHSQPRRRHLLPAAAGERTSAADEGARAPAAHGRRAPRQRRRRDGPCAARVRPAVRLRLAMPLEGPRLPGRDDARRAGGFHRARAAVPQDARRRHAAGRLSRRGRHLRARTSRRSASSRTTRTRAGSPRAWRKSRRSRLIRPGSRRT